LDLNEREYPKDGKRKMITTIASVEKYHGVQAINPDCLFDDKEPVAFSLILISNLSFLCAMIGPQQSRLLPFLVSLVCFTS